MAMTWAATIMVLWLHFSQPWTLPHGNAGTEGWLPYAITSGKSACMSAMERVDTEEFKIDETKCLPFGKFPSGDLSRVVEKSAP